jgi:large subunit ribosomal protein L22
MKAQLTNYRQSPRKVRLVAGLVRGMQVTAADAELTFLAKRSADPIKKLLASAVANAKANFSAKEENLYIKEMRVDKGVTMRRSQPRSHGMATRINKRSSHVLVVLEEREPKAKKSAKAAPVKAPKAAKPKAVKKATE